jgi:hypothetical protein
LNRTVTLQTDDAGNHRLIAADGSKGQWVPYISISTLVTKNGARFFAVSSYFQGTVPVGKPLHITEFGFAFASEVIPGIRPDSAYRNLLSVKVLRKH